IEKYLKKGDFDLYDSSYSTDEMDFIYNTNYKHRRNSISILGDLVRNSKNMEAEKHDGLYEYNINFEINEDLYELYDGYIDQETIDELFHNKKNGFLATKEVGDFALISRLKKSIERAFQDESMSPNLLLWLFDITKAEIPADKEIDKEYEWKNKNLNEEQKKAVQKMLATKDVCLIQGPPGTGKTTVIAEAIYHFVRNNKRVLLASQTNLAVDNALERLVKDPNVRAVRLNDSKASDDIEHLKEKNVLGHYFTTVDSKIKENYLDKWRDDEDKIIMLSKNILDLKNYSSKLDELNKQINDKLAERQKNIQDKSSIYANLKTVQEEKDLIKLSQNEINKFLAFLKGENSNFILQNDFLEEIKKIIMSPLNKIKDDINLDTLNIFYLTNQSDLSRGLKEIYENLKILKDLKVKLDKLDLNNVNVNNIDIINRINEIKDEMPEADPERFLELKREKRELERQSNTFALKEVEKKLFNKCELRLIKNIINTNMSEIEKLDNIIETEIPKLSQIFLDSLDGKENENTKNIKILEENLKVLDGKIFSNKEELSQFSNNKKEISQKINKIRQDNRIDEDLSISDFINELEQSLKKLKDSVEEYKFIKENFGDILENFHKKLSNIDLDNENEYYKDIFISSCNVVGISCTDNPKILEGKGFDTFDVVIIDEVSKATPPELLLPILKSRKIILVGDHRQLPPLFGENERTYKEMVEDAKDNDDEEAKQLLTEDNFHKYEKMVTASVFKEYFETAHHNIKHSLLEQFRMHTEIMNVINRFY
ncbi:AAA domain-containing protein, partial [Campylobacter devanensis]|uniref:AAA domain-containing protein n=1 Tax=Campylobacter devanensis TaxID=3161138 RepID=UPI001F2BA196